MAPSLGWPDLQRVCVLKVFSSQGRFLRKFGRLGDGPDQFNKPSAIAYERASGHIWVVDGGNNRIQVMTTEGKLVTSLASTSGTMRPVSICMGTHGRVFVGGAKGIHLYKSSS